jgi:hypothetical protein
MCARNRTTTTTTTTTTTITVAIFFSSGCEHAICFTSVQTLAMPVTAGAVIAFLELISAVADKRGKSFCRYPEECSKVQQARTLPDEIVRERELLQAMAPGGWFLKKSVVEATLKKLQDSHTDWTFVNKQERVDWITTMDKRIRCLARVVGQADKKSKKPSWWAKLGLEKTAAAAAEAGGDGVEPDDEPAAEEEEEAEAEEEEEEQEEAEAEEEEEDEEEATAPKKRPSSDANGYTVVFNTELMLAKRFKAGKEADAELSFPLDAKAGKVDDLVKATFLSGVFTVPGLTYRRLQSMRGERGAAAGTGKLWEQTHTATSHAIYIAQRVDRFLLLSVFEQTKQRLQIRVDKFGPVHDQHAQEPVDSLTLQLALAFLTPIAKDYADNKLELKDLKAARDDKLAMRNNVGAAPPRSRAVKKRPAAALDSATASGDADQAHVWQQPCIEEGVAATGTSSSTASSSTSRSAPGASKRYVEYEELPDVPKGMLEHFLDL